MKSVPLNITDPVWDFATQRYARVVSTTTHDGSMHFKLDKTVPRTPCYPDRWRTRGELGNKPTDSHSFIYTVDTIIGIKGKAPQS